MDDRIDSVARFGMGGLPHIEKLGNALSHFLVNILCECGATRTAELEALARLWGHPAPPDL
jgi:hypothetical protein